MAKEKVKKPELPAGPKDKVKFANMIKDALKKIKK